MPVSHREHRELQDAPPRHPCTACGHAVSEYRWRLGYDVCYRCEESGVEAKKHKRELVEGDDMAAPGKLSGKGPEIYEKRESGVSPTVLALAYGCSEQAIRTAYKMEKARRAIAAPADGPVTTYFQEPNGKKPVKKATVHDDVQDTSSGQESGAEPTLSCFGSSDCPRNDAGEGCPSRTQCLKEHATWAAGSAHADAHPHGTPADDAAEGNSATPEKDGASTAAEGPDTATEPEGAAPPTLSAPAPILMGATAYCDECATDVFAGDRCLVDGQLRFCGDDCGNWGPRLKPADRQDANPDESVETTNRPIGRCSQYECLRILGAWCIELHGAICGPACTSWKLEDAPAPMGPIVAYHETLPGDGFRTFTGMDPRTVEEISEQLDKDLVDEPVHHDVVYMPLPGPKLPAPMEILARPDPVLGALFDAIDLLPVGVARDGLKRAIYELGLQRANPARRTVEIHFAGN
jgi:hypothetical protein